MALILIIKILQRFLHIGECPDFGTTQFSDCTTAINSFCRLLPALF